MKLEINYKNSCFIIDYYFEDNQNSIILYLHGLGCSKNDFTDTVGDNLKHYDVLAFDFPGHGDSNYPMKIQIEDLVEITKILLDQLKISDIIIIGHSLGGLVGLLLAEKYPEKVTSFINIEGNLDSADCFFSRKVTEVSFDKFKSETFAVFKKSLLASKNTGLRTYANILKSQSSQVFYEFSSSLVELSDSGNLLNRFLTLPGPKIFVFGSENNQLLYLAKLKQQGVQLAEISNSNHFPQYDNPIELYSIISNFIKL